MAETSFARVIHLTETASTSDELRRMADRGEAPDDFTTIIADFQTAGRGQVGNHWESEAGQNLLLSTILRPKGVDVSRQFLLSMAVSLAVTDALATVLPAHAQPLLKIKWPNDIYVAHGKMVGILVENRLRGREIADVIVGAGVNVNQTIFRSNAPNPLSVKNVKGQDTDVMTLAHALLRSLRLRMGFLADGREADLAREYMTKLYNADGDLHPFADAHGRFLGRIISVAPDGRLTLETEAGERRQYTFKEVEHVVPTPHGPVTPNLEARDGRAI